MKPAQMVALLVAVVLIVFVATFARQYLGQKQAPPVVQPTKDVAAALHFPRTVWPDLGPDEALPPEMERNASGHHDFWFENTLDRPVQLHLSRKNCTCSEVLFGLAPAGHPGAESPPPEGVTFQKMVGEDSPGGGQAVEVPGRARGWVRMVWNSKKLGPERLVAEMWSSAVEGRLASTRLESRIYLVDPVLVLPDIKEVQVEALDPGSPPREASFVLFSATRPELKIEPEPAEVQKKNHPFVSVGRPVPLGEAERAALAREHKLTVRCAYRLPVTIRERLDDGSQNAIGPFRTPLNVPTDATDKPLELALLGSVRGEVSVVSDTDIKDRILLGSFPSRFGVTKTVALETEPGVELVLERVPDFMRVQGPTKDGPGADRQTWTRTVSVEPNQVNGSFPRKEDLRLQDTAIYLRTKSQPPRRVRIPVGGNASQR
jgi:hypothetical protein